MCQKVLNAGFSPCYHCTGVQFWVPILDPRPFREFGSNSLRSNFNPFIEILPPCGECKCKHVLCKMCQDRPERSHESCSALSLREFGWYDTALTEPWLELARALGRQATAEGMNILFWLEAQARGKGVNLQVLSAALICVLTAVCEV